MRLVIALSLFAMALGSTVSAADMDDVEAALNDAAKFNCDLYEAKYFMDYYSSERARAAAELDMRAVSLSRKHGEDVFIAAVKIAAAELREGVRDCPNIDMDVLRQ